MQTNTRKQPAQARWLTWALGSVALTGAVAGAQAQTVFLDDFGASTVRTTSPYVPQAYLKASDQSATSEVFTSGVQYYTFADLNSTSTNDVSKRKDIENGYYAVGNPAILATGAPSINSGYYWFFDTKSGGDHTDGKGAVLAVNAGKILNEYYRRPVSLEPGATYELSAAFYITNSDAASRFEIQQTATGDLLAKSNVFGDHWSATEKIGTQAWVVKTFQFTVPSTCSADTNYSASLRNMSASNNNNDFYADDIQLVKVASATSSTAMACATTKVPTIAADDDSYGTVYAGETTSSSVRVNDSITQADGTTVATTSSNSSIRQTSTVAGITLRDDGYIDVAVGTTPGTYQIPYQICIAPETKPWPTCADAVATIVVPTGTAPVRTPDLTPTPDDYTSTPTAPGGKTPSVITNDSSSDGTTTTPLTPTDIGTSVTVKLVGEDPSQFTMNPDGSITVSTTTPPGNYTLTYEVCAEPAQTPANCKTTTVSILVQRPIDAVDDDFSAAPTAPGKSTPSVLSNDTLDGASNPVPSTDVTVTPDSANPPPAGFTVNPDGTITVDASVPPGDYAVTYKICAASNAALCDTAVAKIKVAVPVVTTPPTIVAEDDDLTSTPTEPGKTTPSILGNDTLNSSGNPVPVTEVIVGKDPASAPPTGFTINPDGTITVDPTVTPGEYAVPYRICATSYTSQCDTAIVKITVGTGTTSTPPSILATDDDFTTSPVAAGGATPSLLTNDTLNGITDPQVGAGGVTVASDPALPKVPGFTVNPDGTITVDPTVTAGTYDVPYEICSNTTTVVCDQAVAKITVPTTTAPTTPTTPTTPIIPAVPVITANDNDFSSTPVEPGQSTPLITGDDTLGGVPVTPGTDVTVGDDPSNAPPAGFTINPDGTITVDPTVTPGTYVVNYQICEAGSTSNCSTAKVTIVVTTASSGGNNGGGLPTVPTTPVTPATPATATPVPTLQTWGLALMSLMLAAVAMRRRARG